MSEEKKTLKIIDGLNDLHEPENDLPELKEIIGYVKTELFKTGMKGKVICSNKIIDLETILSGNINVTQDSGWGNFKVEFYFTRKLHDKSSSGSLSLMYFEVAEDETRKFITDYVGRRYLEQKIMNAMMDHNA